MKILANFNNYNKYNNPTPANRPTFKADPHINELLKAMEKIELSREEKIIPKVKNTTSKFVKALRGILLAATLSLGAITGYFAINNETNKDTKPHSVVATTATENRTFIVKDKKYGQLKLTEKGMQQYQGLLSFYQEAWICSYQRTDAEGYPYTHKYKHAALKDYRKKKIAILKSEGEIDINNASNNHTFKIKSKKWNLTNEGLRQYLALIDQQLINYNENIICDEIQMFLNLLYQLKELPETETLNKYVPKKSM